MSSFQQNNSALPVPNANQKKSEYLLPKFFRTDTNRKFLGSTVDQLISPGSVEKINAFVGRRTAKSRDLTKTENYLSDVLPDRENYQLEPALTEVDELDNVLFYKDYIDYVGQLKNFGAKTKNHSKINSQEFYAWNPNIDFDKFTNFREYYWLPNGPLAISVFGKSREIESTYTVRVVRDDDNDAYVFSPNGFTRNPTLTLYRGETYRFDINATGYGMAFATNRTFLDLDPIKVNDRGQNVSALYTKGVTSSDDYLERGTITFKVPDDAPDVLYYVSETDINVSGVFNIRNIEENTFIDVESEIVGKKTYKSTQNFVFSNGMKINFLGEVTPEKYKTGNWYIEGVGEAIRLISEIDLDIPAQFTKVKEIPFDSVEFDAFPLENSSGYPSEKDYIVINRASADGNPWSRYNRWFHQDVVVQSAKINNQHVVLDQYARASRPIIEFEAGLRLFNHGTQVKGIVDLVDNTTRDVFSTVEGSIGYYVDNVLLSDGMRVLFTADTDPRVKGRIYQVKFLVHNGNKIITLIPTADSEPESNQVVIVRMGNRFAGSTFYYSGSSWRQSQRKTRINQHPLFDMYDSNGVSFSNTSVYPASTFVGNRIFGYKISEGVNDIELGFPLTYQNISNIGDIVFEFDLLKNSFVYQKDGNSTTVNTDNGFLRKYDYLGRRFEYVNGWIESNEPSKQYVIRQYDAEDGQNEFKIDVYNNSALITDLEVKVYVNNRYKFFNKDYTLITKFNDFYIKFKDNLSETDTVVIKAHSLTDKNQNGYYEIPSNFEINPLNENITDFTLGEVNDHVSSVIENLDEFTGVFPGINNLRDLGNYKIRGRKFLQHSGPLNLALFNITDKSANALKAVRKAKRDYVNFKKQFLKAAFESPFTGSPREHVDYIFSVMIFDKNESMPYFTSDMVPYKGNQLIEYNVIDTGSVFYSIPAPFSLDNLCTRSVLVYINEEHLIHKVDYEFDQDGFVKILKDLSLGDVIRISYYENTNGSFVPPTPTKLGIYPKFIPQIFQDDTYLESKTLIRGHDGSVMLAYGDYRDDLVLEFERRIYNNIKVEYDTSILDIHEFVGGAFRNTGFTSKEIDDVIVTDFSQWLISLGTVDYTENPAWDVNNSFTYNYKNSQTVDNKTVSGTWRKIFVDLYDTDHPHTKPWEMLGFFDKPAWWESVYGPAPYTSNNSVLWNDIEQGIIREPNRPVVKKSQYSRVGIKKYLPVDENGMLLSPLENNYVSQISSYETNQKFVFGDWSPVETTWRKSSDYPFALLIAWMILQPAKIFGLAFDRANTVRDRSGALVYKHTQKRLKLSDIRFPQRNDSVCLITGNVLSKNLTAGIINYVADYLSDETNRYEEYKSRYQKLSNNLAFRLGGYAEKSKLKLVLDSRSPLNKGNVFVPDENYKIFLNKSSALETVTYSGVILEKVSQGFRVTGYDVDTPYFEYNQPFATQTDASAVVGGVSESFVEWNENKTYALGTVVRYNGSYYRSKISHVSGESFDPSKFAQLSELPLVGGRRILIRKIFNPSVSILTYGTILTEIQQVVDFMLGYQNNLKVQGFKFEYVNPTTQALEDWLLAAKEFVFWTTQNWDVGSVITLSPCANKLIFEKPYFIVDNIYDSFYNYKILKSDGTPLAQDLVNTVRTNSNEFSLVTKSTTEDGIYFAKLPLVQKEHVVLIDNRSVFNDIIYDTVPGYRQERLQVVGYRTDDWNGSLNIPGFVYDQAFVTEWKPWTDYHIGDIVKYKEFYYSCDQKHNGTETFDDTHWNILNEKPSKSLLPNWDYKAEQISQFYSLEVENFDSEQQRLAQHFIGYQKRQYLENIITDEVSQYKFYQGFIQDKGTRNALEKLFNALGNSEKDSLEFYEEWAMRIGQYGAVDNFGEVEFKLNEQKYRLEPQTVELVDVEDIERTDLIYQLPNKDVYLAPVGYSGKPFPTKYVNKTYTENSGYVNSNHVTYTVRNYDELLNVDINEISVGDYIWVLKRNQDWDVVQVVNPVYKIENIASENNQYLIKFDDNVKIKSGEIVGFITNEELLKGFYKVLEVRLDTVIIESPNDLSVIDMTELSAAVIVLESRRFENFENVNNKIKEKLYYTDLGKVWIDSAIDNKWSVYENNSNPIVKVTNILPVSGFSGAGYGSSISVNSNNTIIIAGLPEYQGGAIYVYYRINETQEIKSKENLIQVIRPIAEISLQSRYGHAVNVTADERFIFVGAPDSSNVKTRYKGEIDITNNIGYEKDDVVSDRGKLWRAKNTISYSDAEDFSSDWESISVINYDKDGYSGFEKQGAVYVYERNVVSNIYELKSVLTSPHPAANENFGYSIKSSVDNGVYTLFVGAPGSGNVVVLDNSSGNFEYQINKSYAGSYKGTYYYSEGEIVTQNGVELYQALTNIEFENEFDATKWKILEGNQVFDSLIPGMVNDSSLENSQELGSVFDVSNDGLVIAVTGFKYLEDLPNNSVSLYRLVDGIYTHFDSLVSEDKYEFFGKSVSVSDDGSKIAVGAPNNDATGLDNGAVYVYKLSNTNYLLDQTLTSPANDLNEMFGWIVQFNDNELVIGSKNGDMRSPTTFDNLTTVFDKKSTIFSSTNINTGNIYIYENISGYFVYADERFSTELGSFELHNFTPIKNHLYVAIPEFGNTGKIVDLRVENNVTSWKQLAASLDAVNLDLIRRAYLYNTETNSLLLDLDYIDPRQGKIAGPAEQELTFKTFYDPAVYSYTNGEFSVIVDEESAWTFQNVGKLWWDLSTSKWYNPYQGDSQYRVSYWNTILPDASVDVYEWVESTMIPSQWDRMADTNEGFASGISGRSLYGDSVYSEKRVYNNNDYTSLYYFWVKNKKIIPNIGFRKLTSDAVANLIRDPQSYGYRFIAFTGNDRFTLYNSKSLIDEQNVALNVSYFNDTASTANVHNEYQILTENLDSSKPTAEIEKKWIDSLVGYDANRKEVPDSNLPIRSRYGVLSSPRQGMFINRKLALKQAIERVNSVFINKNVVDGYDLTVLYSKDSIPNEKSGLYDTVVDNYSELRFVNVAKVEKATLTPIIEDGKIISVEITNGGRGYRNAPSVFVNDAYGRSAVFQATIDSVGKITNIEIIKSGENYSDNSLIYTRGYSVLVRSDETADNKWSIFEWNTLTQEWNRAVIQSYDTQQYWFFTDWYANGYDSASKIDHVIEYPYLLSSINDNVGDLIKINNLGSGGWAILKKTSNQIADDYTLSYQTVARQNGTIQLSSRLYDTDVNMSGFDNNIYGAPRYDTEPVIELRKIFEAIKNDIFVGDLEIEWNNLFFSSLRYVLSEQPNVDWLFKTSFVKAKHNFGSLDQPATFKNDNLESYQDYIEEVKPYSTKVREFVSSYEKLDPVAAATYDFDNPAFYNSDTMRIENTYEVVLNGSIAGITDNTDPVWLNNSGYKITEIRITNAGKDFTIPPKIIIDGGNVPAQAYLQKGKLYYIEVLPHAKRYMTPPEVIIDVLDEGNGSKPKAVAILGDPLVKTFNTTIKFDRVSRTSSYQSTEVQEQFVGNGTRIEFDLLWPIALNIKKTQVFVGEVEILSDEYAVKNQTDTKKGYTRSLGVLEFSNPPATGEVIKIFYNRDVNMFDAVDRITHFYKPTAEMPGSLAQLMSGIEYSGVNVTSYGFGNERGFSAGGFGTVPWDTYDQLSDDRQFVLNTRRRRITLDSPFERGEPYNVYLFESATGKETRVDDPNYGTPNPVTNPNAKLRTVTGNGTSTTYTVPTTLTYADGDIIKFRKSTSDGSFAPRDFSYDSVVQGGTLLPGSAAGLAASDITIDGEGFVTKSTSEGPEEMVPGQVTDTLDISVYNSPTDGSGVINSAIHRIVDGSQKFTIPGDPISNEAIFVKINNEILDDSLYTVNYKDDLIELKNKYPDGTFLSITTIGANGKSIYDYNRFIIRNRVYKYELPVVYPSNATVLLSLNGRILRSNLEYSVAPAASGKLQIIFPTDLVKANDVVNYIIFAGTANTFSQVSIDRTFVPDGIKTVHKFDGVRNPVPFNTKPLANKVLVKVDDSILTPGYAKKFVISPEATYSLDTWAISNSLSVSESSMIAFVDGEELDKSRYIWNRSTNTFVLIEPEKFTVGSELEITVIENADYYFVDTQIDVYDIYSDPFNLEEVLGGLSSFELIALGSGKIYTISDFKINGNTLTMDSYLNGLPEIILENPFMGIVVPPLIYTVDMRNIRFTSSSTMTFDSPPAGGSKVEIYQFSNHDINNLERIAYDVLSTVSETITDEDERERNLLFRGFINLRVPAYGSKYVWAIKNGKLLSADVDYILTRDNKAVQLKDPLVVGDKIEVMTFNATPSLKRYGFRIFKDMLDRFSYKRINQNNIFRLATPLRFFDKTITLVSAEGLFKPNRITNVPGILFIGSERIEYFDISGNVVSDIRRGTLGTGVAESYAVGTLVYDQNTYENINYSDEFISQTFDTNGTQNAFDLDFSLSEWINTFGIPTTRVKDMFDVKVAGYRLEKISTRKYDLNKALDSIEADISVPAEYTVDIDSNQIVLTNTPPAGVKVVIIRKIGKIWNDYGKPLDESLTDVSAFLLGTTG
jgi:hypothetical protein